MASRTYSIPLSLVLLICVAALSATAQSFRVQCPTSTITHPVAGNNNIEPSYTGPTTLTLGTGGYMMPTSTTVNGAIKCQQISGGDGYATMGDGTQTYMFSFGPLSGLSDIANGLPGTEYPNVFNTVYTGAQPLQPGDPANTGAILQADNSLYNGAVGLLPDVDGRTVTVNVVTITESGTTVTVTTDAPLGPTITNGSSLFIGGVAPTGYNGTFTISSLTSTATSSTFKYTAPSSGLAAGTGGIVASLPQITGHVDPRSIMDIGVMNGNIPAPLMAIDEDDEFFLTLTNVGMIMRPDLFEQHTVHFHGYPNASSFYDGVPDASVAINIGGSFTYYYLAPDAGTYFYHCHITPPEHLQMGMVGQLYVRPRQNRVPINQHLYAALQQQQTDPRTSCNPLVDILCSNPLPAGGDNGLTGGFVTASVTGRGGTATKKFAYNDGDGSTQYDVEYPLQMHGFDPNFHFVGMTFNPEGFADMKDKYFLLNGRSYPDTVSPNPMKTYSADGAPHFSQPLPAIVNIPAGKRALLRISSLDVSEYQTLASLGIPMEVIAINAKLLRDQAGNNLYYNTNSITLGGGESLDVILDATDTTKYPSGSVFYLYTPNLDHLSNDAENFGGLMTEVHIN